jgi:hypothetical protein
MANFLCDALLWGVSFARAWPEVVTEFRKIPKTCSGKRWVAGICLEQH